MTHDWYIKDIGDNGEFLSWATLVYVVDGVELTPEVFHGSSEEPPGYTGEELARSAGQSWWETQEYTVEERLGPFGLEYQREAREEGH